MMEYELLEEKIIKVDLPNKVNSDNYMELERQLDDILNTYPTMVFRLNASNTEYVSSAGLRVFLKYQKLGQLESIEGVSKDVIEIFDMTGLSEVMHVKKAMSVEDNMSQSIIGEDSYGYIYKKDDENVIRVYKEWVPEEEILLGTELSKIGMAADISNAITFDTVRTDKGLGCVYAVGGFESVRQHLAKNEENIKGLILEFVHELKKFRKCDIFEGKLQNEVERLKKLTDERLTNFSDDELKKIKECISLFPRNNSPIFEVVDTRTILYFKGDITFLDLSILRYGNEIFELAALYRNILEHGAFMGASGQQAQNYWINLLGEYVDSWEDDVIEIYSRVAKAFASLMSLICNDPNLDIDIKNKRCEEIKEQFITKYDELKSDIALVKKYQQIGNKDTKEFLNIDIKKRSVFQGFRKRTLLKDIKLSIEPGEMVLLLGGSGAGKTTFLNAVTGYEKADAKITKGGVDIYRDYDVIKHRLAFAPQQDLLRDDDTVYNTLKNAADMRLPVTMSKEEKDKEIERMLDIFGLLYQKDNTISSLSGGQRKRCSIAVEFISDPILFFLDEPDSGLDGVMARSLMEDLRKITGDSKIIIVISHAPDRVIDLFDKVIILAKAESDGAGHLAFYGTPKEAKEFFERETMEQILRIVNRKNEGGEGRADECISKYEAWK